jgi:hypothetical protein
MPKKLFPIYSIKLLTRLQAAGSTVYRVRIFFTKLVSTSRSASHLRAPIISGTMYLCLSSSIRRLLLELRTNGKKYAYLFNPELFAGISNDSSINIPLNARQSSHICYEKDKIYMGGFNLS